MIPCVVVWNTWKPVVLDKRCTTCGGLSAANANFCAACGAQKFEEASAEQLQDLSLNQGVIPGSNALFISVTRLLVLSAVTSGLYFFYWTYLTWRQLHSETKSIHYPVWHALTLLVPVYGLFRFYEHVRVILGLARKDEVETSLTPGLAVALITLNWVLALRSAGAGGVELLVLNLIRFALTTTAIVWAQSTLNDYWHKARGTYLQDAPIELCEKVLIVLGILIWLNVLLSIL